jgi:hypothetical protein
MSPIQYLEKLSTEDFQLQYDIIVHIVTFLTWYLPDKLRGRYRFVLASTASLVWQGVHQDWGGEIIIFVPNLETINTLIQISDNERAGIAFNGAWYRMFKEVADPPNAGTSQSTGSSRRMDSFCVARDLRTQAENPKWPTMKVRIYQTSTSNYYAPKWNIQNLDAPPTGAKWMGRANTPVVYTTSAEYELDFLIGFIRRHSAAGMQQAPSEGLKEIFRAFGKLCAWYFNDGKSQQLQQYIDDNGERLRLQPSFKPAVVHQTVVLHCGLDDATLSAFEISIFKFLVEP